jgi:hypothetical protein
MICYQLTYLWLSMVKDTYKEAAMKKNVFSILLTTVLVLGIVLGIAGPVGAIGGLLTGVSITGTAQVGGVLTAVVAPSGASATYQWEESANVGGIYTSISGATSSTYTPVADDENYYIEVVATGTGGYSGTEISAATSAVAARTSITAIGAITGTAQVGSTLTVGAVTPSGATVTYQWQRSANGDGYDVIVDATSSTYTPVTGDAAYYIRVAATGTGIYSGIVSSAATSRVAAQTPIIAISVITGTAQVGSMLTAGTVTPPGATVTYQWQRCTTSNGTYTNITNATSPTYTPVTGDATYYIEVVATGFGIYSGSATSAPTSAVAAQTPLISVSITGTAQVGSLLTAVMAPSGATVNYQWLRSTGEGYTAIVGATLNTYTPVAGDATYYILVGATGTGIYSGSPISALTSAVLAQTPITAIGAITGTAQVGSTLTAGAVTPSGATVTYQWQRCTTSNGTYTNITNATSPTYTPVSGDATYYIEVVATGTGIYSGSATSAATSAVAAQTQITAIGAITGTAQVGSTLTAGALTPSGATVNFQWQRSASGDGGYTVIDGATSPAYTPVTGDTTYYIEVVATGVSPYSGTVTSAATSAVAAQTALTGVTVTGTVQVGNMLTANVAPAGATVTYQWTKSATAGGIYSSIPGSSTGSTYTLVTSDAAMYIEVIVTGTGAYSGKVISAATSAVAAQTTTLTSVSITGTVQVGNVLTAVVVPSGATVNYEWMYFSLGNGQWQTINGAISSTYTPAVSDVQRIIRVVAIGTGIYSGTVTSTSALVGPGPITDAAISGVTAPVTDEPPVTINNNADSQFGYSVAWSPDVSYFMGGTVYTATITLNPKTGYTATGVANFFTVDGATSVTNEANSNIVTAVFPTTYDYTIDLNPNGWTLVSTDNYIITDGSSTSSAFLNLGTGSMIYKYTGTGWATGFVTDLDPVHALYVKTTGSDGQLGLNYSGIQPGPSTVNLVAGWNLISTASYGYATDILSSLRYVQVGTQQVIGLATLVNQGSVNYDDGYNDSFYVDATNWRNLSNYEYYLSPFDGYWVYMNAPTTFGVIPTVTTTNIN